VNVFVDQLNGGCEHPNGKDVWPNLKQDTPRHTQRIWQFSLGEGIIMHMSAFRGGPTREVRMSFIHGKDGQYAKNVFLDRGIIRNINFVVGWGCNSIFNL